jgi:hypothetical protein
MTKREKKLIELGVINTKADFGCIFVFKEDHKYSEFVTFWKWESITLVHEDKKYEHQFYHPKFRWVVEFPWKIDTNYNDVFKFLDNLWHDLMIGDVMQWIVNKAGMWYPKYVRNNHWVISEKRWPDLSLPFHKLPEDNQKAVCDLLCNILE